MPVDQPRSHANILIRGLLLGATIVVSSLNGTLYSPVYDSIAYLLFLFLRGYAFATPVLLSHLASILIAIMTLLFAGISAALYERIRGLQQSTSASLSIWLVAAAALSVPTLMNALADG